MRIAIRPGARSLLAVAAGLAATLLFAMLAPAGNAFNSAESAPHSPPSPPRVYDVEIKNKPKLRAGGLAAQVKLRVECPAGEQAWVTTSVSQIFLGARAFGATDRFIDCTGEPQNVRMLMYYDSHHYEAVPFRAEDALIQANLSAEVDYDGFPFFEVRDTDREIRKLRY